MKELLSEINLKALFRKDAATVNHSLSVTKIHLARQTLEDHRMARGKN